LGESAKGDEGEADEADGEVEMKSPLVLPVLISNGADGLGGAMVLLTCEVETGSGDSLSE
jgi:hypothetical protein